MPKLSKTKLTARIVTAAKPGSTIWDSEIKGFGLRVLPSGSRAYMVKYRAGGRRQRWLTIGLHGSPWTADSARIEAKKLLGQVAGDNDPATARDEAKKARTVAKLAEDFLEKHVDPKLKPRTAFEYRRIIERFIVPELGSLATRDVTTEDITKLHHKLRDTPRQANFTMTVARKMFDLAERWKMRPAKSNPCVGIERFPENKRERFLSEAEIARLGEVLAQCEAGWTEEGAEAWRKRMKAEALAAGKTAAEAVGIAEGCLPGRLEAEHPSVAPAIRLLLLTGARLREILNLTWDMVDVGERVLRLPDSKTGAKDIPLAPGALAVIEGQRSRREEGNPHVLPGAAAGKQLADLEKPWQRIRAIAGLPDVRLHDCRHTFASHGAMSGLSLPLLGRVLGHRSTQTTARYSHFAADPVRQAAEAVAKPIAALLMPDAGPVAEVKPLRRQG